MAIDIFGNCIGEDDPYDEYCYQKWLEETEGTNRKMKQYMEDRDGSNRGEMDSNGRQEC